MLLINPNILLIVWSY